MLLRRLGLRESLLLGLVSGFGVYGSIVSLSVYPYSQMVEELEE